MGSQSYLAGLSPLDFCWPNENTAETWSFASSSVSQVFFPLFLKVFTTLCKIYELAKIHNKIPET